MARTSWVQVNGELVPKDQYQAPENSSAMVMPDLPEYQSMITGEMISSRSKHRAHLRQHGCIELGNEKQTPAPKAKMPPVEDSIRRAMHELSSKGR